MCKNARHLMQAYRLSRPPGAGVCAPGLPSPTVHASVVASQESSPANLFEPITNALPHLPHIIMSPTPPRAPTLQRIIITAATTKQGSTCKGHMPLLVLANTAAVADNQWAHCRVILAAWGAAPLPSPLSVPHQQHPSQDAHNHSHHTG